MHDGFIPLELALRSPHVPASDTEEDAESQTPREPDNAGGPQTAPAQSDIDGALAAARRFRAALADALALALERLLCDIAHDVLARELVLAPCDVATIAARALHRYLDEEPLRLRVHPDDVRACVALDVGIVADQSLRVGDAVLELRCGSIDASMEARLEVLLS
jgi:flagellar biosynthesis/type III secretory pathway protein FliH